MFIKVTLLLLVSAALHAADTLRFEGKISISPSSQSPHFFTIGRIEKNIRINKIQLSIDSDQYDYATVRLSRDPVIKFGDKVTAGWYFLGQPPQNMGTFGVWSPDRKSKSVKSSRAPYVLNKGTFLVLEIWPRNTFSGANFNFVLELNEASSQYKRERQFERFENDSIAIPPLVNNYEITSQHQLKKDIKLISVKPTMHLRGVRFVFGYREHSNGPDNVLLDIKNYSVFKQRIYNFKEGVVLKKNSILWARGYYDNSFGNINNPNPFQSVLHGWRLEDEMFRVSYHYVEY